jgi:hypothetical protein
MDNRDDELSFKVKVLPTPQFPQSVYLECVQMKMRETEQLKVFVHFAQTNARKIALSRLEDLQCLRWSS